MESAKSVKVFLHFDVETLLPAVIEAGQAIRDVYEQEVFDVELKADRSPLTEADRSSHRILTTHLSRVAPEIPVLSEEGEQIPYSIRSKWEYYFLIDPLDGTREFVKRIPEFAINVALIHRDHPVLGIIHSPLNRISFVAEQGSGAFRISDQRERLPLQEANHQELRIALSRTDQSPALDTLLGRLPRHELVRVGSSLKFCFIAEGSADFYPRLKGSMEWDTAAGTILVKESGGSMLQIDGTQLLYNRENSVNPPFYAMSGSLGEKIAGMENLLFS